MIVIYMFNKCFLIWFIDVIFGDVIVVYIYFCWYVVIDYDDCIYWNFIC